MRGGEGTLTPQQMKLQVSVEISSLTGHYLCRVEHRSHQSFQSKYRVSTQFMATLPQTKTTSTTCTSGDAISLRSHHLSWVLLIKSEVTFGRSLHFIYSSADDRVSHTLFSLLWPTTNKRPPAINRYVCFWCCLFAGTMYVANTGYMLDMFPAICPPPLIFTRV